MASNNGMEAADVQGDDPTLFTELTDEAYEELASLEGSTVIGVSFWDSSVVDDLDEDAPPDEQRLFFDLDLYLEDQSLLELFGTTVFRSPDSGPLVGLAAVEEALIELVDSEAILNEVAQTEDDALALMFYAGAELKLILAVSAWSLDEWEDLPED